MTPESKSHVLTIAEVVGLCIVVLIIGVLVGRYLPGFSGGKTADQAAPQDQAASTVQDVAPDTYVPGVGETVGSADIAVPASVTEAAPGVEAQNRSYDISVSGGAFSPSTVIVYQGDTTTIRFTAQDKDYDFRQPELGMSAVLPQGEEKLIQVTPSDAGKFTFFCESCGGPGSGPVGYLVVVPKE